LLQTKIPYRCYRITYATHFALDKKKYLIVYDQIPSLKGLFIHGSTL